jgi:hypothetical protein
MQRNKQFVWKGKTLLPEPVSTSLSSEGAVRCEFLKEDQELQQRF